MSTAEQTREQEVREYIQGQRVAGTTVGAAHISTKFKLVMKDAIRLIEEPTPTAVAVMEPEELIEESDQSAEDIERQIEHLEDENKELQENDVLEDIEFSLPEIPADASNEQKLEILKETNEKLVDIVNEPESYPKKPKYGSGLAVSLTIKYGDEIQEVWVDEHGVDIDSGEKVNMTPELKAIYEQTLDRLRAENAAKALVEFDKPKELHSYYAMTKEEYDQESEKEYPIYIFPKQPGPEWRDTILYGPAGDLVRKAMPYNEAHPAGILLDFLVSIGSMIGRGPYFNVNGTKHYCNEFLARVGDSARSRKGSGRDAVNAIAQMIDSKWYTNCVMSGFGSGEAIISNIRDTVVEPAKLNHRTGKFESVTIPGVDDKRLCIREGELSRVFVLAGKSESQAGMIIRDGWDGNPLRNIVKGKGKDGFSNSAKCEEPHLSISGDTTISELKRKLPAGAAEDGFGNRFLYCYVYRTKHCPQGGPPIDWSSEILDFTEIIQYARTVKHVSMSPQARKYWNRNYSRLENEGPAGLAGKMTARGPAHIRRIAVLYALIDQTDIVNLDHLHAAERIWKYCEESAVFIFGGVTREQLRIVQWIDQRGAVTFNQVRDELYQRNKPVANIRTELSALVKAGQLFETNGMYALAKQFSKLIQ